MRLIRDNVERIVDSENQVEKFKRQGFRAVDFEADGVCVSNQTVELGKKKVDELRELEVKNGIEGAKSLTKSELLAVLKDVI